MSSNWHDVRSFGAVGDGVADDTAAIQAALDAAAGGGTVEIPRGDYMVTTFLVARGGTTVHAYGARVFTGSASRGVLRNFEGTDEFAEYEGNSDIKILGGTWDGNAYNPADGTGVCSGVTNIMNFAHCSNILVRDAIIRDIPSAHGLELNAVAGARVESCRFEGFIDNTEDQRRVTSEALQIDIAKAGSTSIGLNDGTPCRDVAVLNCFFGPSDRLPAAGRAAGSHSIVAGRWYDRIRFSGCEVHDTPYEGFLATGWRDSDISGNKFWSTGSYAVKADRSARVSIIGNHVYGHGLLGIHSSEILVADNQIRTSATNGINLAGVDEGVISGNLVSQTLNYHGITAGATSDAQGGGTLIVGNKVVGAALTGFRVSSPNTTVTGNLVRATPVGVDVSSSGAVVLSNDVRDTTTPLSLASGTVSSGNVT